MVITVSDLKSYYRAIVTKIIWHRHKTRFVDKGNQMRRLEKSKYTAVAAKLLTKVSKTYISEKTTSSRNHAGKLGIYM